MSKASQMDKCMWIMTRLLEHRHGLSYVELMERWQRSSLNIDGTEIPKRTMTDYKYLISEMFGVDIECDRRDGYRYYIDNWDEIDQDEVKSWLLSLFAVSNAIHDCKSLRSRIAYDEIPSGNDNLQVIIQAMQKNAKVNVIHQSFVSDHPHEYVLSPYFLKVFKQRWYLVAVRDDVEGPRVYALDRMKRVEVTKEKFKMPKGMSVDSYFYDCFGVLLEPEDYDVEKIRIKVTDKNNKRKYLRTLPLHHSQREVEKHDDYSIFELTVYPSYDFIHEILSHGEELEVVEPAWVRNECKLYIEEMYKLYH
ncbi:MAG: WYL domain-containing protein [Prevotella sp.]|jgi:predicted DNA-binding transcriptional regulator YafY|nr:WYL domain-containing protein [Prevotella sp.]